MKESEAIELLKQYKSCKRFIDSQAYIKEYFNPYGKQKIEEKEIYEEKMRTIESLVQLLAPSDEYTFLRLHYIKGIAVEKCAESMFISTSTAYRLRKKALERICDLINSKGATDERAD